MATLIFDNTLQAIIWNISITSTRVQFNAPTKNLCLQFQDKNGIMSEKNVNGHKPTIFAG